MASAQDQERNSCSFVAKRLHHFRQKKGYLLRILHIESPSCLSFSKKISDHHRFCFFISRSICSDARHESAIIVSVGFLCVPEAKAAASITKRFFTSQL